MFINSTFTYRIARGVLSRVRCGGCNVIHFTSGLDCLGNRPYDTSGRDCYVTTAIHRGQTQYPTSHPVARICKLCISPKRLRREVRKKTLLEIQ